MLEIGLLGLVYIEIHSKYGQNRPFSFSFANFAPDNYPIEKKVYPILKVIEEGFQKWRSKFYQM